MENSSNGSLVEMPELPDIAAYIHALEVRIVGQPLERVRIANVFLLRTTDPPISAIEGHVVTQINRVGKRIAIGVEGDFWLVLHLMIAGRLHWRPAGATIAGRGTLAAFDFPNGSLVLTEAGKKRRASMLLLRGENALATIDPGGIDIYSADLASFRAVLARENHTLKRAMTDPHTLSGIGNAYSDEILHAAHLSPIAQTQKLTDAEWERLYTATRDTLTLWTDRLQAGVHGEFPEHVTAFHAEMAVHGRYGKACPTCGEKVRRIRYADNETNYCAKCQTGGKILADRAFSRLLGADWATAIKDMDL
jgi:formamidopyrimidine-DNA glycosylase